MLDRVGAIERGTLGGSTSWRSIDGKPGGGNAGAGVGGMLIRMMETLSWAIMFAAEPSTATATRDMLRRAVIPNGSIESARSRAVFRRAMGCGVRDSRTMFLSA